MSASQEEGSRRRTTSFADQQGKPLHAPFRRSCVSLPPLRMPMRDGNPLPPALLPLRSVIPQQHRLLKHFLRSRPANRELLHSNPPRTLLLANSDAAFRVCVPSSCGNGHPILPQPASYQPGSCNQKQCNGEMTFHLCENLIAPLRMQKRWEKKGVCLPR